LASYDGSPASDSTQRIKHLISSAIRSSKRHGTWFRLTSPERAICTLAVSLDVKFKSIQLMRTLVSILRKMKDAGSSIHALFARGREMALFYSETAVGWGNTNARAWRHDAGYIRFLDIMFRRGIGR